MVRSGMPDDASCGPSFVGVNQSCLSIGFPLSESIDHISFLYRSRDISSSFNIPNGHVFLFTSIRT
jgi:hypothetical protein